MYSKSFTSKIYKFENLPEPKNATEEEQKAFYISRSYDFSISSNDNDSKESPRLSKKLKIENDVQNDHEREFVQQQLNIGTNDEEQNNPSLHSEQVKSEILDDES
ncbi:kinase-like domain-containing protein [Rhizophagus irregularis DAOM 181602=DAOM 197198]|nr:kinase-like domain-containing protein [Rhizophagus irregularis DAOM 181602=DAOM 197198]